MRSIPLLLFALAACSSAAPHPNGQPVADPDRTLAVHVAGGIIAGEISDDVVSFKGVPYAAAPVGALRWRAPQPPVPWPGVRVTQSFGNDCIQALSSEAFADAPKQSEDCLYLNVWAPHEASVTRRYPVLVWFHGGAYLSGSAALPTTDGSSFARQGIVVVSANYRLGRMGFFAHPALTAEGERPNANYGLLDQLAVLKWVKENIAAVGGDPAQVTIAGQSAGGMSVIHLMTWPAAHAFFHRAIVLSGGGRTCIAEQRDLKRTRGKLAPAEQTGVDFARTARIHGNGADALASLRALPAQTINKSLDESALQHGSRTYAGGPIIDGVVVTDAPEAYLRAGRVARVPVLIGTTGADIPRWYDGRGQRDPYAAFGDLAHEGRELYEGGELMSRERLASVIAADMNMHEPARFLARRMTARGTRAWLFRFDYVAESQRALHKHAPHASELAFLFNQLEARLGRNATPHDRTVATSFHGYVANFVRSGDPNAAGLAPWPAFNPARYDLMMFTREGRAAVQPDVLRERIALIEALHE